MSPFARFLLLRILMVPLTLLVVTVTLMGMMTVVPPEVRALLYLPSKARAMVPEMGPEALRQVTEPYIQKYHMEDPFPVQYAYWVFGFIAQRGGYSPSLKGPVLDALLSRTPVTAELTVYSLIFFISLGIYSGLRAGWRQGEPPDLRFRAAAYLATSLPPFIAALVLINFFYTYLGWFPTGRLGIAFSQVVRSPEFHHFTQFMTIDSLLNGRLDIFWDSLRHLVLPVIALSLMYWATLGRIVRSEILVERDKDYLMAARSRGIPEKRLQWGHAFPNILAPALSSSALAAASLFTGVFMIEIIFDLKGVAELIVKGTSSGLDVPIAMGFSVYSIIVVLVIMFVLDIFRALLDPRARENMFYSESR
jgi:ABC-type dipeptide/oligopeptide/nickel transport system permease component